jgi:putative membrane protein
MHTVPELINKDDKRIAKIINVLAIVIPIVVAILIGGIRQKIDLGAWTKFLPHLNGLINTLTSLALIAGLIAIKQKNIALHRLSMLIAFVLGAVFLVTYVIYHISNPSTAFGGEGWIRPVYYFLLISHILLSIGVVFLVLKALYFALSNQIVAHKKVVKWAYPIWLYVSVSGVLVYLMISPYYQ